MFLTILLGTRAIPVFGVEQSSEDTCSYFQVLLSRNKELD